MSCHSVLFGRSRVRPHALVLVFVALAVATLPAQGRIPISQARELYQRGDRLFTEAKYREAYDAYQRSLGAEDADLSVLARKGKIRSAQRLAQFTAAHREADLLRVERPNDAEATTLFADSLWGEGWFDEAELAYQDALVRFPDSPRARFGVARSLATRGRTEDALAEAIAAAAASPRDAEIVSLVGDMFERLYRFDEAAKAYEASVALLPKRLLTVSSVGPSKLRMLRSFSGRTPVTIDGDPSALHVIPFRLDDNKKILIEGLVNGRRAQFLLDTGSERTTLSRATAERAGVQTVSETVAGGVGAPGVLTLKVARVDTLEIGSLRVRHFPVSVRSDNTRNDLLWQEEIFSPIGLGLSVVVDYERRELTLGRQIPDGPADVRLPLRVYRLPMVRGLLNERHPAYFVVDTGGELISISSDVANRLNMTSTRRIRLRVVGMRGLDPDAFLLTGVSLDFNDIAFRQQGVAVLNLRAPSVLLGFQLGGILGHSFLAPYRVAMDLARGELRLQRY